MDVKVPLDGQSPLEFETSFKDTMFDDFYQEDKRKQIILVKKLGEEKGASALKNMKVANSPI